MDFLNLVDMGAIHFDESGESTTSWIHALSPGEYDHPVWGKLKFGEDELKGFNTSVKDKVRGIDLSINYNHNNENIAAGWVKESKIENNGLWLFIEWTKDAYKEIKDKKYRYFSAEFLDEWVNPQGQKFKNVLMGGGLTNRPWMKNLLPINLSESTIEMAVGLAEVIQKAKAEGEDMDLKKLNELLGLPVGTSESDAFAKLTEAIKPPAEPKDDKKTPTVPGLPNFSSDLKKLAEDNPMVKALMETVSEQHKAIQEHNHALRESNINKKLAEFDNSKIILSPAVKDQVHNFLMEAPTELHESFWSILSSMKTASGLLVELGERGGVNHQYGRSKDAVSLFMDEANKLALERKISLDEAMVSLSSDNPTLYNNYRANSYSGKE